MWCASLICRQPDMVLLHLPVQMSYAQPSSRDKCLDDVMKTSFICAYLERNADLWNLCKGYVRWRHSQFKLTWGSGQHETGPNDCGDGPGWRAWVGDRPQPRGVSGSACFAGVHCGGGWCRGSWSHRCDQLLKIGLHNKLSALLTALCSHFIQTCITDLVHLCDGLLRCESVLHCVMWLPLCMPNVHVHMPCILCTSCESNLGHLWCLLLNMTATIKKSQYDPNKRPKAC